VGPVKRSELRPQPEKVREWMQRTRKPLRRTPRKARVSHTEARRTALQRSRGRCIVCGSRAVHGHHVLPVSRWPELTAVAANIVACCEACHARHENAHRRIRWEELPECAILLAQTTSGAAAVYLDKIYPR
jgi:5-methylcytosine-specific restriction endonuclease McrA